MLRALRNTLKTPTLAYCKSKQSQKTLLNRSFFSSAWNPYRASDIDSNAYHAHSNETMDTLLENLEELGDNEDYSGFDVEYSSGVLTLKLGDAGTYVINKQPPNKQIWLSSPKSGPKRFDYDVDAGKWFYQRDDHTLDELLNRELSEIFKRELKVL